MRRILLAAALSCATAAPASADSWLSMRGAYYKEYSTRVSQPMLDGQVEVAPDDTVTFHALVDSITSASPAAGNPVPVEFNEKRYEAGGGWTHRFGLFSLGGTARYSDESDYTSYYASMRGQLEMGKKNTTLALTVGRGYDQISNGVAAGGTTPLMEKTLHVGLTSLSLTQVLTPEVVGNLTFDLSDMHGYQANLYRRVPVGGMLRPENVPDLRLRAALYAGVRAFLPPSETVVVAGYRFYADDWGVVAHTVELRAIQPIVDGLEVRLRVRAYTQSDADFYQEMYDSTDTGPYVTVDQKLSSFTAQTFGGQVGFELGLLGVSGSWADARVDVMVDRILQDNDFGDAWALQAGLVVPFAK
jgi:hypothetical protein